MDALYAFFSHLILVSAGLVVCVLWIVLIVLIGIEIYDAFTEKDTTIIDEEEDY